MFFVRGQVTLLSSLNPLGDQAISGCRYSLRSRGLRLHAGTIAPDKGGATPRHFLGRVRQSQPICTKFSTAHESLGPTSLSGDLLAV